MLEENILLDIKSLYKSFPGVKALKGVDLRLFKSEIHALVGENGAGKSTLMKCLFGIENHEQGDIIFEGKHIKVKSSSDALNLGISMIHQELHPIPHRDVAENIWLGRYPTKWLPFIVDHSKMYEDTKKLFDSLRININPKTLVADLSVSQIQMMEIAKAISYNSKIIVMDEPTSSLTDVEIASLFEMISKLRLQGVSVIYISHKMEEIKTICNAVTIMRDGEYIGRWNIDELTIDEIIAKMVGRKLDSRFPKKTYTPSDDVILRVENFTSVIKTSFKNVSFTLRRGEILGIGGLVGSQRTELMESLFGLRKSVGHTYIGDRDFHIDSAIKAKSAGLALLTEERRATGIFGCLSIEHNVFIASYPEFAFKHFIINDKKNKEITKDYIKKLNIKTPSTNTLIANLSGGNQQKVLIARWLLTNPDILILDEPTRGIDVGAKYEVYSLMYQIASEGKGVIMISSEMPELMGVSDRIMVMSNGMVGGILEKSEFDQEKIMSLATCNL